MNKNAKAWIKALRSDEYAQGKFFLCVPNHQDKFCCLGVACELYAEEHSIPWVQEGPDMSYLGIKRTLPLRVQKWLGVKSNNPNIGLLSAAGLNDSGQSFEEIADWLEKNQNDIFI